MNILFLWPCDAAFPRTARDVPAYPVLEATAAARLAAAGHAVAACDERLAGAALDASLARAAPDIVFLTADTPELAAAARRIAALRVRLPHARLVLGGPHPTARPEQSWRDAAPDSVLACSHPDTAIPALVRAVSERGALPAGVWRPADSGTTEPPGTPALDIFDWTSYAYSHALFARVPGAPFLSARPAPELPFRPGDPGTPGVPRDPAQVADDIGFLVDHYPVAFLADLAPRLPGGDWLHEFCERIAERGYRRRARFACRPAIDATQEELDHLSTAGFQRIEIHALTRSPAFADDDTGLPGLTPAGALASRAASAGIEVALTCYIGLPGQLTGTVAAELGAAAAWLDSGELAALTVRPAVPLPGTTWHERCRQLDVFATTDWTQFDGRGPVLHTDIPADDLARLCARYTRRAAPAGRTAGRTLWASLAARLRGLFTR